MTDILLSIEVDYNRVRRHSAIGYIGPMALKHFNTLNSVSIYDGPDPHLHAHPLGDSPHVHHVPGRIETVLPLLDNFLKTWKIVQ